MISNSCFYRGNCVRREELKGTAATAPTFSYLQSISVGTEGAVDQAHASRNPVASRLGRLELRRATTDVLLTGGIPRNAHAPARDR